MNQLPETEAAHAKPTQPAGLLAIGAFLLFGATAASLAAITFLAPGTALDRIWDLHPRTYDQLKPMGATIGPLFLLLAAALAAAAIGWFRRHLWGYRLALAIIAIQVLGDAVNFLRGDWLRGGIGFGIAGALLLFLLRPRIRNAFS